jgi:hypothetical protein
MILAGLAILAAGVFLLRRDFDKAFIIATLGMLAWFLNYRAQMKEIVAAADREEEDHENADKAEEDLPDELDHE